VGGVTLADPVASLQQLRELMPTFGVKTLRRSIEVVAEQALEVDDEETRELAEQLLRELRKIPA
jgi:hypothetical protein